MVSETPETWVHSLGQEDPLEKEMNTHSSILDWIVPWTEEPDWVLSMGLQRVGQGWMVEHPHRYTSTLELGNRTFISHTFC